VLTSDKHGYQLCRFEGYDQKGKERLLAEDALRAWAEQRVKDCDAQTWEELRAGVQAVREKLDEISSHTAVRACETAFNE
jgi:hypothetical protein